MNNVNFIAITIGPPRREESAKPTTAVLSVDVIGRAGTAVVRIDVVAYDKTADVVAKHAGVGPRRISVTGRLASRPWTDAEGTLHWAVFVVVEPYGLTFLDPEVS